jgi:pectate lyase
MKPFDLASRLVFAASLASVAASCGGIESAPPPAEAVATASAAALVSGVPTQIVGVQSGKCVGVSGSSDANNALLQIQGCSGSAFQQWIATADGAGFYALENAGSGKCMDVTGNSSTAGTNIQQFSCSGNDNQKWSLSSQGGGVYALVAKSSGLALDVFGARTANGTRLIQWTWKGTPNQEWTLGAGTEGVSGFASLPSDGIATTTGGGSAAPSLAADCASLKALLEDAVPRVVQVPAGATLDCRTANRPQPACQLDCGSGDPGKVYWRVPVPGQTCADLGGGTLVTRTRNDFRIHVRSNKTLVGAGAGAVLQGVSFDLSGESNVIVRNVTISEVNPSLVEAGDGLTINDAHHVWIDHSRFSMISDGYFDIQRSRAVTVSWSHLDGRNPFVCGGQHHYVSLVDASQVTYHHDFFDHTSGRNPKVTGASLVHLFNDYYLDVTYFCLSAATGSSALVEDNVFQDSRYPQWSEGGLIEADDDLYLGTSADAGQRRDDNADVAPPAYHYTLDAPSSVPAIVTAGAGPRAL